MKRRNDDGYYEKRAKRNMALYERRKYRKIKFNGYQESPRITIRIIIEEAND